jgi:hypothetical protein
VNHIHASLFAAIVCSWICNPSSFAQGSRRQNQIKPLETTVCAIANDPAQYDNKLVRIRGYVQVSFEYSTIGDEGCPAAIWFTYAGSTLTGLVYLLDGPATPRATNYKRSRVPPIKVTLVRDSDFDEFEKLLTSAAKINSHLENIRYEQRVTATFIGRIDSVSSKIHKAHQRRSPTARPDFEGYGQFGMFDSQLVVEKVENDSVSENVDIVLHKVAEPIPPPSIPIDLPDAYPPLLSRHHDPIL